MSMLCRGYLKARVSEFATDTAALIIWYDSFVYCKAYSTFRTAQHAQNTGKTETIGPKEMKKVGLSTWKATALFLDRLRVSESHFLVSLSSNRVRPSMRRQTGCVRIRRRLATTDTCEPAKKEVMVEFSIRISSFSSL